MTRGHTPGAASLGLLLGCAWLLGEGTYLTLTEPTLPWWAPLLALGVGAPAAVLLSAATAMLRNAWVRVLPPGEPWRPVHDHFWGGTGPQRIGRTSAWLAGIVLVPPWLAATIVLGIPIAQEVRTPGYAVAALAGLALTVGLFAGVIAIYPTLLFRSALRRLDAIAPRLVRPGAVVVLLLAAPIAIVPASLQLFPNVAPHLPWAPFAGAVGALVVALSWPRLLCPWMDSTRLRAIPWAALSVVAGLAVMLPAELRNGRSVFLEHPSLTHATYLGLRRVLDFDGDGTIGPYGGGDCAPFDRRVGPHAEEIPRNGIDENCSGRDLSSGGEYLVDGKKHHPMPQGRMGKRPHIILVTTDALSHGHTTMGGYGRDTTPNLAAWAKRATVFDSAFSFGTSTRTALSGILAGKPNAMVAMKNAKKHPYAYADSEITIASMLKRIGYRSVFIPGDKYFFKRFGHGFSKVDKRPYHKRKDKKHAAPEITDAAIELIRKHREGRPLFLWIHYYDHHGPYVKPKGAKAFGNGRGHLNLYDTELHFTDAHWGRLLRAIESTWDPADYLVVFTSDHGEAFDANHRTRHHDRSIRSAVLHVPLVIQAPDGRGRRIAGLVSHADIIATLANVVAAPVDDSWIGESLVPVLFGDAEPEKRLVYSMYYIPEDAKKNKPRFRKIGVRTDRWYFTHELDIDRRTLTDWRRDALDNDDLRATESEQAEILSYVASRKLRWFRTHERGLMEKPKDKKKKKEKKKKEKKKKKT